MRNVKVPYITNEKVREELDYFIDPLIKNFNENEWEPGEVNYTISRLIGAWFLYNSRYKTICSIIGTLECVSKEFYRRVGTSYEDHSQYKNGDIPEYKMNYFRQGT